MFGRKGCEERNSNSIGRIASVRKETLNDDCCL